MSKLYRMHPIIAKSYERVHSWFDLTLKLHEYKGFDWQNHKGKVLNRINWEDAAFNFNLYFPTHYFKACHVLTSEEIIGLNKLSTWLRYNPHLTVIDIGCGDGAGSAAIVGTLAQLREAGELDPRPIQVFFLGIDPNKRGLSIYKKMMDDIRDSVSALKINIDFDLYPHPISQSSNHAEKVLSDLCRSKWKLPSISHTIMMMSNVADVLLDLHKKEQAEIDEFATFLSDAYMPESFGEQLSSFVRQVFEMVPIDHLHLFSIDTKPEKIRLDIEEMIESITTRLVEKEHTVIDSKIQLDTIEIVNPDKGYWKEKESSLTTSLKPFMVSVCHLHNKELNLDVNWKQITGRENLELAWARARQAMLRESFSDEIEIRLFEQNLESNLERLHFELDSYAIHAGFKSLITHYAFPKNQEKDRQRGLSWLEEEILVVAIIQVIGSSKLNDPRSYAYRLSPENSVERGATEYLYERWTSAWKNFRSEIEEYAQKHPDGVVIKTDIKSYFTRILHDRLNQLAKEELQISKRIEWLLGLLVNKNIAGHDSGRGLVQGSIGSGFLANLYLSSIDRLFLVNDNRRRLYRYLDDIVVIVSNPVDEQATKEHLYKAIENLGLEINEDKDITYPVQEYLSIIASDELLDEFQTRYEELIKPLWWTNESIRAKFQSLSSDERGWWFKIEQYKSCLTALGLFVSNGRLSRIIAREISKSEPPSSPLVFPDFPIISTIAETIEWGIQFKQSNKTWDKNLQSLKTNLESLFISSFEILNNSDETISKHEQEKAIRRLRFATNRLATLGFENIHEKLVVLLCLHPWFIREHTWIIEELARQSYAEDVWALFNFHEKNNREMSVYLNAITLRALRFLPRLEMADWEKLNKHMFQGSDIVRLMATETWLFLTSNMNKVPFANQILEQALDCFSSPNAPGRRLLKNYLLIIGKFDTSVIQGLGKEYIEDPLLQQAFKLALTGLKTNPFELIEPEIIRKKYYNTKYQEFIDEGDPSPY